MNAQEKKIELFERIPIPKAVMTLSVPAVLSSLVMVIYNLSDTYFVGLLNDPLQNAAVTLSAPVLLAFNAVNNLFGVGSSSMMSRALGAREYDTVRRSSAFGFYMALICAALFSLLCTVFRTPMLTLLGAKAENMEATRAYLMWTVSCGAVPAILNVVMAHLCKGEGAALHASIGTMSGCLLNIILDPFFIEPWGLNLGAAGAGCATFLANCCACLYFFIMLHARRGKTWVCISPSAFRPTKEIVIGVCTVGVPASIQNLLNVTGMTVLNNSVSAFGSEAVAAMGIAQKTTQIPMYISMGISQGIMPLVGYNYSAKNPDRMKGAVLFAAKVAFCFLITMTVCYYAFAPHIIGFFMNNDTIIRYGAAFMRGFCLAQPFLCMDFLAVGVFQACGFGHLSLLFAVLRKIVLEIPALVILNRIWPMYGLPYSQLCAEFVLAIAAVLFLRRIFLRADAQSQQSADADL